MAKVDILLLNYEDSVQFITTKYVICGYFIYVLYQGVKVSSIFSLLSVKFCQML